SGTHDFSYGPGGLLYDSNTSRTYTPGLAHREGGIGRTYHQDWQGSTRYFTNAGGNTVTNNLRYEGFGTRRAVTGSINATELAFAGGWGYQTEYTPTGEPGVGLQYLDQRYY